MCQSPDEMSTERIEYAITNIRRMLEEEDGISDQNRRMWTERLEGFERILKERAENGTY
jgi:hypothetical protein